MSAPQTKEGIRRHRREEFMTDEPLNTETRDVTERNQSLYANLTSYARATLNIDPDDEVHVSTYRNGIWIEVAEDGDES